MPDSGSAKTSASGSVSESSCSSGSSGSGSQCGDCIVQFIEGEGWTLLDNQCETLVSGCEATSCPPMPVEDGTPEEIRSLGCV